MSKASSPALALSITAGFMILLCLASCHDEGKTRLEGFSGIRNTYHDDHLIMYTYGGHAISIMHHPDCPKCLPKSTP